MKKRDCEDNEGFDAFTTDYALLLFLWPVTCSSTDMLTINVVVVVGQIDIAP